MPMETTLRPPSMAAVSTIQLVRRRSFGKVVRLDLAPAVVSQARAGVEQPDGGREPERLLAPERVGSVGTQPEAAER